MAASVDAVFVAADDRGAIFWDEERFRYVRENGCPMSADDVDAAGLDPTLRDRISPYAGCPYV